MALLNDDGLIYLWNKITNLFLKKTDASNTYATKTDATQSASGLMSAADKKKLDGVSTGANKYTHPKYTNITEDTDDLEVTWGSGVVALADTALTDEGHVNGKNYVSFLIPSSVASTTENGLMSSADKSKLDGVATGANKYTHPTTSGNKHIPSGGSSGQILKWSADGTAVWGEDKDTVYTHPTSAGNKHIPSGGSSGQILRWKSNGTAEWGDDNDTVYTHPSYNTEPNTENNQQPSWGEPMYLVDGITVDELGHVSGYTITRYDLPVSYATATKEGLMSSAMFTKLNALPSNATLESTYAKKTDIAGTYKYKGSVADATKLPTSGQTTGDVYNIETASAYGGAGMNVAWNGTAWDPLGEIFSVDYITNARIDEICV